VTPFLFPVAKDFLPGSFLIATSLWNRREASRAENHFLGGRIRISSEFANAAGAPWSLRMRTPFPERSQARPEETLKPSVEAKIFFVPSALNSRIAWLLAQGDWWSFPFFSLSASRYFGDKETFCLYWPLGDRHHCRSEGARFLRRVLRPSGNVSQGRWKRHQSPESDTQWPFGRGVELHLNRSRFKYSATTVMRFPLKDVTVPAIPVRQRLGTRGMNPQVLAGPLNDPRQSLLWHHKSIQVCLTSPVARPQ
jgi:hypothetical protein